MEERKRILAILSSSRKNSNSTLLAEEILKGAESKSAEVEIVRLSGLDIKPCRGCYACAKEGSKGCIQRDDMSSLYPKIAEADLLVLATPVYFFNMSGQLKIFLDRCLAAQYAGKGLKGKGLVLALAYGDVDPFRSGCVNAIRCFQDVCAYCDMAYKGQVYASGMEPGEIISNTAVLEEARQLGEKAVSA